MTIMNAQPGNTHNQDDASDVLSNCFYMPHLSAKTRDAAIGQMVTYLASRVPGLPGAALLASVLERERLCPTGTPDGVAFPHGKLAEVDGVYGVVATMCEPVSFGDDTAMPCRILVLTVSSSFRADGHLLFLSHMARCLYRETARKALLSATDENEFIRVLRGRPYAKCVD
jgi:nitrogen PTS system EIIA component